MKRVFLKDVWNIVGFEGTGSPLGDVEIRGLAVDSREVKEGYLFFALPGTREHGSKYIPHALESGAVAAVTDVEPPFVPPERVVKVGDVMSALCRVSSDFYGNPSRELSVVGVTGTNGKTTVSYILEGIASACGEVPGVVGTVNYRVAGEIFREGLTTPFPHQLQEALARIKESGGTFAVMEVSSHGVVQGRIGGIIFKAGLFTNLSRDHLDYHGNMEEYYQAKKGFFTRFVGRDALKVVNVGCQFGKRLAGELDGRVVTYSVSGEADYRVAESGISIDGIRAILEWDGGAQEIESRLVGEHNLENILAAFALARELGMPEGKVAEGIRNVENVPGRLERVDVVKGVEFFVDYAHTPGGLENVIAALSRFRKSRLIVVFGCGGDRDRGKRPIMGEVAAKGADVVIVTSDNPRTENPSRIIDEIIPGCERAGAVRREPYALDGTEKAYCVEPDRRSAIAIAVRIAREGDIVLIAGKGHETYQIIGNERHEFDDREVLREFAAR